MTPDEEQYEDSNYPKTDKEIIKESNYPKNEPMNGISAQKEEKLNDLTIRN